jgi:hypothetical protein
MRNIITTAILCVYACVAPAQELFVFTEPASNMPANSIAIRANNYFMQEQATPKNNYHLVPEVMVGLSKKLMLHAQAFISNRNNSFVAEGAAFYAKYRFLSIDDVHTHFRLATFARLSHNNSDVHQPAIDFMGHSSGTELGIVATQLLHKIAVSSSISAVHAFNNGRNKFIYSNAQRNAINYTLSFGKLMLPKTYTNYNQPSLNLMLEVLGQTNLATKQNYLDVAPSVQIILQSKIRVDFAYRTAIINNLYRTAFKGLVCKFEYNWFSIAKNKK